MNPARLYVGIDNTQPNVVRVAILSAGDLFYTWPIARARCRTLPAFQAFWKGATERHQPVAVATTVLRHDPFDTLAWLSAAGFPATQHDRMDLLGDFDQLSAFELPPSYRRAHALALRAAYFLEAPRVVEELWHEMGQIEGRVKEAQAAFNRLLAVTDSSF